MATHHRTARGIQVDMDRLRLANEKTIAVGNMKVNARGDQLGPGGKVIKTRTQVLAEKNKTYGALADDSVVHDRLEPSAVPQQQPDLVVPVPNTVQGAADDTPVVESAAKSKPRGSFAESLAEPTEVKQELLNPKEVIKTPANEPGIKRI